MTNTPFIMKTTLQDRKLNSLLLKNFHLAFSSKELDLVMMMLHSDGVYWGLDKKSAERHIFKMMYSLNLGTRNLLNVILSTGVSDDHKPGQPVLKLTFHDNDFLNDINDLNDVSLRKIEFVFAFSFRNASIAEIRTPKSFTSESNIEFLSSNN